MCRAWCPAESETRKHGVDTTNHVKPFPSGVQVHSSLNHYCMDSTAFMLTSSLLPVQVGKVAALADQSRGVHLEQELHGDLSSLCWVANDSQVPEGAVHVNVAYGNALCIPTFC